MRYRICSSTGPTIAGPAEDRVHLGVERDFRPARKAHPGLLVRDVKSLSVRLTEAGYEVTPGEPLEGDAHIYANDPFGNRLELLQATD